MVKASAGLAVHGPMREGLDRAADRRPDEAEDRARDDDGKGGDDRHRAFAREEAEVRRAVGSGKSD